MIQDEIINAALRNLIIDMDQECIELERDFGLSEPVSINQVRSLLMARLLDTKD